MEIHMQLNSTVQHDGYNDNKRRKIPTDEDDQMGAKINYQKNPWGFQQNPNNLKINPTKKTMQNFSSLKNFWKALNKSEIICVCLFVTHLKLSFPHQHLRHPRTSSVSTITVIMQNNNSKHASTNMNLREKNLLKSSHRLKKPTPCQIFLPKKSRIGKFHPPQNNSLTILFT